MGSPGGPSALERLGDVLAHLLGVAEQHHRVLAVEQRIVDAGGVGWDIRRS
jgi:hypothetical protein